jgi:hypothetical protein
VGVPYETGLAAPALMKGQQQISQYEEQKQ